MNATHGHKHHILPLKVYFGVAGSLFVLTVITVYVAQFDFGAMNVLVAMAVAAIKGSLVALFFMHLKYDNKLYASFFVGSLVFLAAFVIFTMFDTERRDLIYPELVPAINASAEIYDQETGKPLKMKEVHGEHGEEATHSEEGHTEGGSADGESGNDH